MLQQRLVAGISCHVAQTDGGTCSLDQGSVKVEFALRHGTDGKQHAAHPRGRVERAPLNLHLKKQICHPLELVLTFYEICCKKKVRGPSLFCLP